jgi:ABC-type multidrug transport system fused ATPase/permease subunit
MKSHSDTVLVVAVGIDAVLLPLGVSFITDYALLPHDLQALILILAASIGAAALGVFSDHLYARMGNRLLNDLRFNMYRHLQRFSIGHLS